MSNVTPLRPVAEPRVWCCGHCGSQHFRLFEDGSTECALCEFVDTDQRGGWAEHAKPDPDFDDSKPTRLVTPHGTADFAKASILRSVDADAVALVVLWPDGRTKVWSIFDNKDSPERQAWLRNGLQIAADLALGAPPKEIGDLPE